MTSNLIEIEEAVLHQGRVCALDGASMVVPAGSVTALLGRNGAGKSSLLDAVLGLVPLRRGRIRVLGEDPRKAGHRLRAEIGAVEADPALDDHDTVERFLAFVGSLYPTWDAAAADAIAGRLGLPRGARIGGLSRGQRCKVALAAALPHGPRLLVLDEPFDGLDRMTRREILAEIIHQVDSERGIVIATHDLAEIENVADRVIMLDEGKVRFEGTIDELRSSLRRKSCRCRPTEPRIALPPGVFARRHRDALEVGTLDRDLDLDRALDGFSQIETLPPASLDGAFELMMAGAERIDR